MPSTPLSAHAVSWASGGLDTPHTHGRARSVDGPLRERLAGDTWTRHDHGDCLTDRPDLTGSQADSATNVLQREFSRFVTSALSAVLGVPPRSDHARSVWIQVNGESLGHRIKLEIPIWAPFGGHRSIFIPCGLQNAAELHVARVEDPGAMARLQNDDVHDAKMLAKTGSEL
jgi:hypothetical protein